MSGSAAQDGNSPGVPAVAGHLYRGVQFLRENRITLARQCFEAAREVAPRDAIVRNCLGIVARNERRISEALECFRTAIELRPDFAEAHNNMGNAFRDIHDFDEAKRCYEQAIAIKEEFSEAHNNLGVVLLALGTVDRAVHAFERAITLQPKYAEAHNNLANAYRQQGDAIAAAASLETALQYKPDSPDIHNNLANVLRETGQWDMARHHYERAIRLRPNFAEAHENLGTILIDLDRGTEAIQCYEQAARLREPTSDTLINLGNAYRLVGRVTEARATYDRVTELEPHDVWNHIRACAICPPAFSSTSEMAAWRTAAIQSWRTLAEQRNGLGPPSLTSRLSEPAFAWQFLDGNLRSLKESFSRMFGAGWPRQLPPSKDRVGVVVTAGHEGIFLRSLAGVLQRCRLPGADLVVFCPRSTAEAVRRGLGGSVEVIPLPVAFSDIANTIEQAACAVLYHWEIGTDATNYYLPFLSLSPVQCTSWGVQVTSGIRQVDYYLASAWVEPEDAHDHYTEQLLLSSTMLTYQVPPILPQLRKTRGDFGFRNDQHLYLCPQQPGKFHPDFDPLLGEILRGDETGLVVAVSDPYGNATDIVRRRLRVSLPDVVDRIVFLPRLPFEDYLQLLDLADVILDPPHFGGVNSTYDALAVGQAIVTLPSGFHRGRYTAGCLKRMENTETVARSSADYARLALELAGDPERRSDIRQRMYRARSALFRDEVAVREHERLFQYLLEVAAKKAS